jgi:hypothetical protein
MGSGVDNKNADPHDSGKDAWTFVTENRSFRFEQVLGDEGTYEALLRL